MQNQDVNPSLPCAHCPCTLSHLVGVPLSSLSSPKPHDIDPSSCPWYMLSLRWSFKLGQSCSPLKPWTDSTDTDSKPEEDPHSCQSLNLLCLDGPSHSKDWSGTLYGAPMSRYLLSPSWNSGGLSETILVHYVPTLFSADRSFPSIPLYYSGSIPSFCFSLCCLQESHIPQFYFSRVFTTTQAYSDLFVFDIHDNLCL